MKTGKCLDIQCYNYAVGQFLLRCKPGSYLLVLLLVYSFLMSILSPDTSVFPCPLLVLGYILPSIPVVITPMTMKIVHMMGPKCIVLFH